MAVTTLPSKNKRNRTLQMSQMNGDNLTHLKTPVKSEHTRDIIGMNCANNSQLKKQLDLWYREQKVALLKVKKEQEKAYRSLLNHHREKKQIQKNNLEKRLKEGKSSAGEDKEDDSFNIDKDRMPEDSLVNRKKRKLKQPSKEEDLNELAAQFAAQGRIPSVGDEKVEEWLMENVSQKDLDKAINSLKIIPPIVSQKGHKKVMSRSQNAIEMVENANTCTHITEKHIADGNGEKQNTEITDDEPLQKTLHHSSSKEKSKAMEVTRNGTKTVSINGKDTKIISIGPKCFYMSSGQVEQEQNIIKTKQPVKTVTETGNAEVKQTPRRQKEQKTNALPAINEQEELKTPENKQKRHTESDIHNEKTSNNWNIKTEKDHPLLQFQSPNNKKYVIPPIGKTNFDYSESLTSSRKRGKTSTRFSFASKTVEYDTPRSKSSDPSTDRSKRSKLTGTVYMSMAEYNKEERKKREEYRKTVLDSEEFSVYKRDDYGNIVPSELSFKRSEFSLPSRRDFRIQQRLLEETRLSAVQHKEKMNAFFEQINKEENTKRLEWEERRRRIRQEEEIRKAKKKAKDQKAPVSRSLDMYMTAFKQEPEFPEGTDPNSFEVIKKCRYIRIYSPSFDFRQNHINDNNQIFI